MTTTAPSKEVIVSEEVETSEQPEPQNTIPDAQRNTRWNRSHTQDLIIGDAHAPVRTRAATANESLYCSFLSQTEPKDIEEALDDPSWMEAMHEELNQFERNEVWKLVDRPSHQQVIGTKWVFRNKLDSDGL